MAKEYIEREALLKKLSSIVVTDDFNGTMLAYGIDIATDIILKTSPAADVVEVRHGEWISMTLILYFIARNAIRKYLQVGIMRVSGYTALTVEQRWTAKGERNENL